MSLILNKILKINIDLGFDKMDYQTKKLQIKQAKKVNPICHSMIGSLLGWEERWGGGGGYIFCLEESPRCGHRSMGPATKMGPFSDSLFSAEKKLKISWIYKVAVQIYQLKLELISKLKKNSPPNQPPNPTSHPTQPTAPEVTYLSYSETSILVLLFLIDLY